MTRPPIERYVAFVLCLSAAAVVCAEDNVDVLSLIRQSGRLRVATTGDYRPFSYVAVDGSRAGIDVDLAVNLANELGVKLEWVESSWANLLADLADRRFDIGMGGISVTPARAAVGRFSTPYFTTGKTILARCAVKERFVTLDQVNQPGTTVTVNPGGTNEQFVHAHLPRAKVIINSDNRSIFDALAAGAADVMITDAVEAQLEAGAHPQLCLPTRTQFEPVEKVYLMPPDRASQASVDAWLERMRASGRIEAAIRSHLGTPP